MVISAARGAWPGVAVAAERFIAYVAARIPGDGTAGEAAILDQLARLRTTDLWLACACAERNPAGLAAIERAFGKDIDIALSALGAPAHIADEARQVVRARLFVAEPGVDPAICRYGGRGDLRAWIRATTVRAAIDLLRRTSREVPADGDALEALGGLSDPELATLRARYGAELNQGFGDALAALSRRDRSLLRYYYVDELGIDGIAAIYRVHRATVARWLQRIRSDLLEDTRARLAARLEVSISELDSILRFIGSELDASVSRALRG